MRLLSLVLALLLFSTVTVESASLPVAAIAAQRPLGRAVHIQDKDDVDIGTTSPFSGLTTFANLPYVNCFAENAEDSYDIALLGAPFDTVGFHFSSNYQGQFVQDGSWEIQEPLT